MKRILLFLSLFATSATAQTITLGPITKLDYCVGDTLVVPYQASGIFVSGNFFTLQLSDANGSFGTFINSGHDTAMSGIFLVPLKYVESHLRVRAASTNPYYVSADNGVDISIAALPHPSIRIKNNSSFNPPTSSIIGFADQTFTLSDASNEGEGCTYLWTFDSALGLSPSLDSTIQLTFPQGGSYSVSLQVTNANGCVSKTTTGYTLLSCSPEIPKTAQIVTGTLDGTTSYSVVVVKTGANLTGTAKWSTIFAEPGSSIALNEGMQGGTIYLQDGASFSPSGAGLGVDGHFPIVIMTPGRTLVSNGTQYTYDTFYCSDMTFGTALYSGVPNGQSIALGPMPTSYHVGDTIIVPYTASGSFGDGNFFSLQLSDSNGSFNTFTNVGHDTLISGQIPFVMKQPGKHFRVRIASSDPYMPSQDNGTDITTATSSVAEANIELIDIKEFPNELLAHSSAGEIELHLFSLLGAEILSQHALGTLDLDLSPLPVGVYFAVIETGGAREVKRIAVVH
jgi:PKD repeat protein